MKRLVIILLTITAIFPRIYRLSDIPRGFFADEAIRGLDAYYLLTRGVDNWGEKFPVFFKVFGEYTPPLQTYSEILPIALLGLNEMAVRLPGAIWSIASIALVYLLAKEIFAKSIGLIAALVMATAPWSIHYGRIGFEHNVYLTLFLLSLVTWLKGKQRPLFWVVASTFWALTLYTYNPAKLIVPIFWLFLVAVELKNLKKCWGYLTLGIIVFGVISLPMINHIVKGQGLIRFNQVSLLNKQLSKKKLMAKIAGNYFEHFSPNFLFFKGDPSISNNRHFSSGLTPLLIPTLPLLGLGVIRIFGLKNKCLWLLWLLIYPLGGTLTSEIGTNRTIIGLPLMAILIASGTDWLLVQKTAWPKIALALLTVAIVIDFGKFVSFYFEKYPKLTADFWGWQYGPGEIMSYFLENKDNYDDLYMSGEFNEGWVFLRFYDPERICKDKCKIGDFWRGREIVDPNRKQLFSLSPEYLKNSEYEEKFLIKKTVCYPDSKIAFLIGEIVDLK